MTDYQSMYYVLMDAAENAINLLIAAQRKCEDIYVETCPPDPEMEEE